MSTALSKPIPVRLTDETLNELLEIEGYTGTNKSTLIRLALKAGLPEIRKKFGEEGKRKPAKH